MPPMPIASLISADSHVVEPPDLWQLRIDDKFKDVAPRLVEYGGVHRWVVGEDVNLGSLGAPSQAGLRYSGLGGLGLGARMEEVPEASYDPAARLEAMAVDGVEAEVVYSTIGTRIYTSTVSGELMSACFRAMNDWSSEFTGAYPRKLAGTALINVEDVDDAITELERSARLGLRAAAIPTYPGDDTPYRMSSYDKFWDAAQRLGIPLGIHAGSERPGPGRFSIGDFVMPEQKSGDASFRSTYHYWAMRSVADMVFAGVFERYPDLRLAVVEHDVGWAPHFIRRMDMTYAEHRYVTEISFRNGKLPSDFIRHNVLFTFMEDPIFVPLLSMVGVDRVMWGSDYPHRESTWPRSREVLDQVLKDLSVEERRRITYTNAAELYGLG